MLPYPQIDPVAFSVGPVDVHWYGLMYLLGFAGAWWLGTLRARRPYVQWRSEQISDLLFYIVLGVIVGGRVGYMLFYGFDLLLSDPFSLFRIWDGGMSFHGGLLGVIAAMAWFGHKTGKGFLDVADFVAPLAPIGLFTGRIGNFINAELWGQPSDVPWAMVFPGAGPLPRHPSQLYEALLEGVVLFAVLWWFSARPRPLGAVASLFLILYGVFRFAVEFVRVPDPQLGYLAFGWLTMGQILSLPMIVLGVAVLAWTYARGGRADARGV